MLDRNLLSLETVARRDIGWGVTRWAIDMGKQVAIVTKDSEDVVQLSGVIREQPRFPFYREDRPTQFEIVDPAQGSVLRSSDSPDQLLNYAFSSDFQGGLFY